MDNQSLNFLSRRNLLTRGAAVATGIGLLGGAGRGHLVKATSDNDDHHWHHDAFEDKIAAVFNSADGSPVRQLVGKIIIDPAFSALAKNILQNYGGSLTKFQASFLDAIGIMTSDPEALTALVSGNPVPRAQRSSLESIREELRENPAVQTLIHTTHQLRRKNANLLQMYVNADIGASLNLGGSDTTLGDGTIDAVVKDVYNLVTSEAFVNTNGAMVPLMQSSAFIGLLQKMPPEILVAFIPTAILIALVLPNDHDPNPSASVLASLEIVFEVGVFAFAILSIASFLGVASAFFGPVTLIAVGPTEGEIVLMLFARAILAGHSFASAVNALYKALDCDHDGDPNDPNDVPGIECPVQ